MNTEVQCEMFQHQMSLPPLRVENSQAQTSDFSKRLHQNSGQSGFDDFTFAASNSNQFYNSNVDDHLIHIGNLDEQVILFHSYQFDFVIYILYMLEDQILIVSIIYMMLTELYRRTRIDFAKFPE